MDRTVCKDMQASERERGTQNGSGGVGHRPALIDECGTSMSVPHPKERTGNYKYVMCRSRIADLTLRGAKNCERFFGRRRMVYGSRTSAAYMRMR
jgi:hypothetical protein